jgi:hypothetical protein
MEDPLLFAHPEPLGRGPVVSWHESSRRLDKSSTTPPQCTEPGMAYWVEHAHDECIRSSVGTCGGSFRADPMAVNGINRTRRYARRGG